MTAAELIEEARDHHESFTPIRHTEKMCRRELRRAELRFYYYIAGVAEGALAADVVYSASDIATALAGTPLTVPSYIKILTSLVAVDQAIFNMTIFQDELSAGASQYMARLIGRKLYLIQPTAFQDEMDSGLSSGLQADSEYVEADAIRLTYVPEPPALTTPTQALIAPDETRVFFVGSLVEFMARRAGGAMGPDRGPVIAGAQEDKKMVLDAFASRSANETSWSVNLKGR